MSLMAEAPIVWRVNRKPRFPVLSLGEYMVAEDGPRETMRRNMKYERISPTLLYTKLQRSVASFLASPVRDRRILARCREEIEAEQQNAKTPRAAENAMYALRSLDAFERSLNALPIGGLMLSLPPISQPLMVEGVKVSIQPTTLVAVARPRGKDLRGAIIIDAAKGTDPKSEDAAGRAHAAMVHSAFLLHEHVANSIAHETDRSSPDHCIVFHVHRQEAVNCPANYKKMLRNVEAACRDIASAWESIAPPPSFDSARSRFRD